LTRAGPCRERRCSQAGFTLLEALVALVLLSLLTMALTAGLRLGIDAWTRGSTHADELSRTLAVQSLLRELLGQAYPYFVSSGPTRGYVDFDGTNSSLVLLAPTPVALGATGRSRFRLSITKRQGLSDLIMTSQPELGSADAGSVIQPRTLLAGTASIEFGYFGGLGSESGPRWYDHWNGQAALPQLVGIHVSFPQGDARVWPDLVVSPRITADVACVYDQITKLCRGR